MCFVKAAFLSYEDDKLVTHHCSVSHIVSPCGCNKIDSYKFKTSESNGLDGKKLAASSLLIKTKNSTQKLVYGKRDLTQAC